MVVKESNWSNLLRWWGRSLAGLTSEDGGDSLVGSNLLRWCGHSLARSNLQDGGDSLARSNL